MQMCWSPMINLVHLQKLKTRDMEELNIMHANEEMQIANDKSEFNPWLMVNIERMELRTMDTPTGWLEWDND